MLGRVGRVVVGLLIGWFVFVFAAMGLAFVKRREAVEQEPDADEVDLVASFAPLDFKSTASAFRGGRVDTWFGGGVLDLRNATLDPMGATIEVNALFGGGNLVVPDDWNVETSVTGIGGAGDGRPSRERSPEAPTLRVEGVAIFGGWGISSTPEDGRDEKEALAPV
jgi:predicted membrane protein